MLLFRYPENVAQSEASLVLSNFIWYFGYLEFATSLDHYSDLDYFSLVDIFGHACCLAIIWLDFTFDIAY